MTVSLPGLHEGSSLKPRVLSILAGLLLVAAACGDGRMSAEAYFAQATAAAAVYEQTTDEVFDRYGTVVGDALIDFEAHTRDSDTATLVEERDKLLETTVAELTLAYEQASEALHGFIAVMSGLEPPETVEMTHDVALGAWQRLVDTIPDLIAAIRTVDSPDDISVAINASAFGDAQPRVTAACANLQDVASGLGLTADLQCGEASSPEAPG